MKRSCFTLWRPDLILGIRGRAQKGLHVLQDRDLATRCSTNEVEVQHRRRRADLHGNAPTKTCGQRSANMECVALTGSLQATVMMSQVGTTGRGLRI